MTSLFSRLSACPSRGAAFSIHLFVSLLVFSTLVAVMLVYWFPGDLFFMDGGWAGLKLVAMVDLVLGPALTLIVFKPGKPSLKMDLSIIAAIQIAALGYGFYTTYHQRTVAVVFGENKFSTVSAQDKIEADKELVKLEIQPGELPPARAFSVPQFVTPAYPSFGKYVAEIFNGYPEAHYRSDQYVALDGHHNEIQRHAKSIDDLEQVGAMATISKALDKNKVSMDDVEIYRFSARYANGYALFDPEQARVIDFVKFEDATVDSTVAEETS